MFTKRLFLALCLVAGGLACRSANLLASFAATTPPATLSPAPGKTPTITEPVANCPPRIANKLGETVIDQGDWTRVDGKNSIHLPDDSEATFFTVLLPDGSLGVNFFITYPDGYVSNNASLSEKITEGYAYETFFSSGNGIKEYGPVIVTACSGKIFFLDQALPPPTPMPDDFHA